MTSSTADPNLAAVVDDRYEIVRRVARGGMATVYEAHDRRLDRPVALKIMHPHLAESADFVARFRREARAAARLSHRNVVAIHDQGTWREAGYLVMEHIPGPNLRQELRRRGSLPIGDALDVLEQVLDALGAAHRAGLVHRDVKPENVLLEPGGPGITAKVTDFGLARAVTEATAASTGTVLGTVAYLAPEIITHGLADPRADVYAAGVLLYELVVGRTPLEGESPIQIAYQHVHGEIPMPSTLVPWLPQELDELVAAMTAREPLERPQDADAARDLLRRCRRQLDAETLARRAEIVAPGSSPSGGGNLGAGHAATGEAVAIDADAVEGHEGPAGTEDDVAGDRDSGGTGSSGDTDGHGGPDGGDAHDSPDGATAALAGMRTAVLDVSAARDDAGGHPGHHGATAVGSAPSTLDAAGTRDDELLAVPIGSIEDRATVAARTRRKRRRILLAVLLLVLAAATAVALWFLLGPGSLRTVPDIAGDSRQEAESSITAADLTPRVEEMNHDDVPAGEVIGTDPAGGQQARRGSEVTIQLSTGVLMLEIPDVTGRSGEDAEVAARDAGFGDVTVSEAYSDTVPAGTVVAISPSSGSVVDHRTPVEIEVSAGPAPVTVPDVTSQQQDAAEARLADLGLEVVVTGTENHDTVPRGAVIRQEPDGGQTLHRGDTVDIVVSEGPVMVEVPDVVGQQSAQARRTMEAAGFTVVENEVLGGFFGTVRSQEPAAGTAAPRGTEVTLTIV